MNKNSAFLAILLLTLLAYFPGLDGELIFDDRANLAPIHQWLGGEIGWQKLVFGNESGRLGRPVAMASFWLNAVVSGDSIGGLKAGNLLIHLATGIALFLFLSTIIPEDRQFSTHGRYLPLILTSIWLLHPLLASTVLYVIQRMAMLSAFFVLLALFTYVRGRISIEAGRVRAGSWLILIGVPLLAALATFSKENGVLAFPLCALIEFIYFQPRVGSRRPWPVRFFMIFGVLLPVLLASVIWITNPDFYLAGYANRPFGPVERLLTESRVLFDYTGKLLIPVGSQFSLLRDDYEISEGLLTPITTLFSITGWIALVIIAIRWKTILPGFAAGIGIFLIGHSLESGIFPLLIYFEHRNYLPSVGIILAVASLITYAATYLGDHVDHKKALFAGGTSALILTLAVATHARSNIWQSNELLMAQSLDAHPGSRHLRMELQRLEMEKPFPDLASVQKHARYLQTKERSSTRLIGLIMESLLECDMQGELSQRIRSELFTEQPDTIEADLFHAINVLSKNIIREPCENLSATDVGNDLVTIADHSGLDKSHKMVWRLRFLAAQLFYSDANLISAYEQARIAWQNSSDIPAGMFLIGLQLNLGLTDKAKNLLDSIEPEISESDHKAQKLADQYREAINRRFAEEIFEYQPESRTFQLLPDPDRQ